MCDCAGLQHARRQKRRKWRCVPLKGMIERENGKQGGRKSRNLVYACALGTHSF